VPLEVVLDLGDEVVRELDRLGQDFVFGRNNFEMHRLVAAGLIEGLF
jgi:hypothetical protein